MDIAPYKPLLCIVKHINKHLNISDYGNIEQN